MLFGKEFGLFLALASLVIGVMLLTGHGSMFMKGGNDKARREHYDEKKIEKASGVTFLAMGVLTLVDAFTTTTAAKLIYLFLLVAVLGALIWYIRTKCVKK